MSERATDGVTDGQAVSGAADTWPISAREAAQRLGISERTVRRAIARGELPAEKHAGVYRIAPIDLARFRTRRQLRVLPGERNGEVQPRSAPLHRRADDSFPGLLPHDVLNTEGDHRVRTRFCAALT